MYNHFGFCNVYGKKMYIALHSPCESRYQKPRIFLDYILFVYIDQQKVVLDDAIQTMMVDMTPNFLTLKKERLFIIQEMKSLSMEILDIENYLEQINTSVIFEEIMSQNNGVNPVVQKSVTTKTLKSILFKSNLENSSSHKISQNGPHICVLVACKYAAYLGKFCG